jgi:hypothetical protein
MGLLQKFHLVIRYKRGASNKVADMLSRPPVSASIVLKNDSLDHDSCIEQYANDEYFKDVYERRTCGLHVEIFMCRISYSTIWESFVFQSMK